MDYFKSLPSDITMDILSRLPAELILECKSVSKTWNHLISHYPSFYRMYLHRLLHPRAACNSDSNDSGKLGFLCLNKTGKFHYFEYNQSPKFQKTRRVNLMSPLNPMYHTRFVGSINGLICLSQDSFVCVCNPITREYVVLPEFKSGCDINFGYVSSTNEYKVVGIECDSDVKLHIYTLGSNKGWRNLGDFKSHVLCPSYRAIFANGTLYWMYFGSQMFITFDLDEEKFGENLSIPPVHEVCRRGILDGILYVAGSVVVNGVECYDIWLFKQKSVNNETSEQQGLQSWSREFRVGDKEILAVTKRGGVLTYVDNYINMYDTKTLTLRRLVQFKNRLYRVCPHKNTLVSLKELGEEDVNLMKSIEIEETKSREQSPEQVS